jgi:hypothetical protein
MSVNTNNTFKPSRLVCPAPATPAKPATETPKTEAPKTEKPASNDQVVASEPTRLEEQKQAAASMLSQLGSDARVTAIMLNPVFLPHAQAIAWSATGRAISRYETETPRKDFSVLMAEEQSKARKQIEALPQTYGTAIVNGAQAAGDAIATGAQATGDAIVTGAKVTGEAVTTGAKAVGNGFLMAGGALLGGLFMGGKAILSGIGHSLSGLGRMLVNAGDTVNKASE